MARTATLPGVPAKHHPELVELADLYVEKRDERMGVLKKEVELKNQLIALMNTLNLTSYIDEETNMAITLETKTKVKVKKATDDDESND